MTIEIHRNSRSNSNKAASHAIKPFYRFAKLSDPCQCGSGRTYRVCCFRSELIGFIVAVVILALLLSIPSESLWSRVVRSIFGLLGLISLFAMFREWFVRRPPPKKEDDHAA